MTETHKYVYGKLRRNAIAFGSQVPDLPALAPQKENTEREEIIRGALAVVGQIAVDSAHTAVMARNVSMRTMQNLRREVALVKCENTRPIYELKSENYVFDRELTKEHI